MKLTLDNNITVSTFPKEGYGLGEFVFLDDYYIDSSSWTMDQFLAFMQCLNSMTNSQVKAAIAYYECNEDVTTINNALDQVIRRRVFDTGCTNWEELAHAMLEVEAFGRLMPSIENSVSLSDLAASLQTDGWVYIKGQRITGDYIQLNDDSPIYGVIEDSYYTVLEDASYVVKKEG